MSTSKETQPPQVDNSVTTGGSNAIQQLAALKDRDLCQGQNQIADIQAGLQEADQGEFASAEEVRAVFAKYGH